jgi:glycyl-tRNA synthetase (class II)
VTTIQPVTMEKLLSLAKRRGFLFQSSEIYGGLNATWDYGPLGAQLKRNVKDAWWRSMVQLRDDSVPFDAAILMHPDTWQASGHLGSFTDPLVECRSCHQRFRADHVTSKACPNCQGEFTDPRQFNLMFKTFMGAVEDTASEIYLRPETAQGIYVYFRHGDRRSGSDGDGAGEVVMVAINRNAADTAVQLGRFAESLGPASVGVNPLTGEPHDLGEAVVVPGRGFLLLEVQ